METRARKLYELFRRAGYHASHAFYAAKAMAEFSALERQGLVRLIAEPEQESYFDVYGEPEGYTDINGRWHSPEQERQELADSLERLGCWYVSAEWRERDDDDCEWQVADAVGMCAGYSDPLSPLENWYVPDLMRSAVQAATAENYTI